MKRTTKRLQSTAALLAGLCFCSLFVNAHDAIWSSNPAPFPSNFNDPDNWVLPPVPNGTAYFGPTTINNGQYPFIFDNTTLSRIVFLPSAALSYSIGIGVINSPNTLELVGGGFTNFSSNRQGIVVDPGGTLTFAGGATAGQNTIGYGNRGGKIIFNNSTAGSANFENQSGGTIAFNGISSAGSSTISNDFLTGTITFSGLSTASTSTISNFSETGGGLIAFSGLSTAGNATIGNFTAGNFITFSGFSNGGTAEIFTDAGSSIIFTGASNGALAKFIVNSGGTMDISGLTTPGMMSGSIEGAGNFMLGSKFLVTGLNNLTRPPVTGVISGDGGQLIKVGSGTLTLLGPNTYSGGTSFFGGIVAVERDANLGTGPLTFNSGTLEALTSGGGITSAKTATLGIFGGTFLADSGTVSTLNGVISGPGSFTKSGPGTLILTNENIYSGGTVINAGTLQLGNGATGGDILGNVVDNGTLAFNHSGTASDAKRSFDGVISGTGSVVKLGPDTLQLTANNSFSGGTFIEDGILVAGIPAGSTQLTSFALGGGDTFLENGILRAPT